MRVLSDVSLTNTLWYKLGGKARYVLEANNIPDIHEALAFVREKNIHPLFVCGTGSNLIFAKEYYDGAILQIGHDTTEQIMRKDNDIIEAFAGEILGHVCEFALDNNLIGLAWAGGLPGTVGAAVRGNVGAYGGETKDTLLQATVLELQEDKTYTIKTLSNKELQFVYRGSLVKQQKNRMIVLSAQWKLQKGSPEEVLNARKEYEAHIQNRKDKHPLEYPNCGSVFKNIRDKEQIAKVLAVFPDLTERIQTQWYGKIAAGHLIQRLGLQGYRVGNAQVSEKHALFIVNLGGATAQDVLQVIAKIQETFQQTFDFELEPEVEIVQ